MVKKRARRDSILDPAILSGPINWVPAQRQYPRTFPFFSSSLSQRHRVTLKAARAGEAAPAIKSNQKFIIPRCPMSRAQPGSPQVRSGKFENKLFSFLPRNGWLKRPTSRPGQSEQRTALSIIPDNGGLNPTGFERSPSTIFCARMPQPTVIERATLARQDIECCWCLAKAPRTFRGDAQCPIFLAIFLGAKITANQSFTAQDLNEHGREFGAAFTSIQIAERFLKF